MDHLHATQQPSATESIAGIQRYPPAEYSAHGFWLLPFWSRARAGDVDHFPVFRVFPSAGAAGGGAGGGSDRGLSG